jgi:nucleoside-diphosphate-sugar epimerase
MDIVLAGATGFIGSYVRKLLSARHRVIALTREESPEEDRGVEWLCADLSETSQNIQLPPRADAIVYLAQSRHYRKFPDEAWPIFDLNIRALMMMLEYARHCGAKRFFYASSANVYKRSHRRITEESDLQPTTFYARSKLIAEMIIESYAQYFHCDVFRLFTVYGPGQRTMLIPSLVDRVRQGQSIEIRGRRGLRLTPMYVTDVGAAIQVALERESPPIGFEVFNVGGDEALSIYDLGRGIGKALNIRPKFHFVDGVRESGWMADSSKLKRTFGLRGFVGFQDGITQVLHG